VVLNLDESDVPALVDPAAASGRFNLSPFLARAATGLVAVCGRIELEIAQLDEADRTAFLRDLGLDEPGVQRVIRTTYDLLGYISFLTAGEDECRAWSIPRGTTAQAAAGEIHTDIARVSSAPRWCGTSTSWRAARSPPAASTARCGSRGRTTWSPTAT